MFWLTNHANELAALGSIFMNIATLVIIFFNMNQFRLNRRSLNIDINFKVFELRKKIYRETETVISHLKASKNFSFFIVKKEGTIKINDHFKRFKKSLENSKYLFSKVLFHDLERFLFLCEHGVALEKEIQEIKDASSDHWTEETTQRIQELNRRKKETLDCILDFELEQFVAYLNISNFHKDFITESEDSFLKTWIDSFKTKIIERNLDKANENDDVKNKKCGSL